MANTTNSKKKQTQHDMMQQAKDDKNNVKNQEKKEEDKTLEDMTSEDISNYMIQAIDIIVNDKVKKANFNKTAYGRIARVEDAVKHSYVIELQDGGEIIAYDQNEWQLYNVGSTVQIEIPQNDSNKEKTIIRKIDNSKAQMTAKFIEADTAVDNIWKHQIIETYTDPKTNTSAQLNYYIFAEKTEDDEWDCKELVMPDGSIIKLDGFNF